MNGRICVSFTTSGQRREGRIEVNSAFYGPPQASGSISGRFHTHRVLENDDDLSFRDDDAVAAEPLGFVETCVGFA